MNLTIVRHAPTELNLKGIINSYIDEPVSKSAIPQINALVRKLHGRQFDAIFSSPLKRCLETAWPIAKDHNAQIIEDGRLSEVNAGTFAGKPHTATKKDLGLTFGELLDTYTYDFTAYGGASYEDTRTDLIGFLSYLGRRPYANVLIVTSGGPMRWIYKLITGEAIGFQKNLETLELAFDKPKVN